jgi:hypothetical protein
LKSLEQDIMIDKTLVGNKTGKLALSAMFEVHQKKQYGSF